jgi:hypothetical protein
VRSNGGLLGKAKRPGVSDAKGLWSLNDISNAQRNSEWPVVGGDPYIAYVTAIYHFNNSYADALGIAPTPTIQGTGCSVSSAQSKFGGYSLLSPSSSGYLLAADDPAFNFDGGAFTIDFWARRSSNTGLRYILCKGTNGSEWAVAFNGSTFGLYYAGSSFGTLNDNTTNSWHHYAVAFDGDINVYCWQDGTLISAQGGNGNVNYGGQLFFGRDGAAASSFFNGYIDDIRITKGVCRWTGNFTAPTIEHPES